MVNYVKTDSVEKLVEHLRNGASITKETVIADSRFHPPRCPGDVNIITNIIQWSRRTKTRI